MSRTVTTQLLGSAVLMLVLSGCGEQDPHGWVKGVETPLSDEQLSALSTRGWYQAGGRLVGGPVPQQ